MPSFAKTAIAALLLALPAANGFVAPKVGVPAVSSPISAPETSTALNILGDVPYGEESRKYRRTVYDFDAWKKHRSQDRFWYNMQTIFQSGIYRGLLNEVGAVSAVAAFAIVWNALATGYTDFDGVTHEAVINSLPKLALPMSVFTVTSPSLGLLLVFRTNASYERWDGARKMWGLMINRSRDVARMGAQWYAPGTEKSGFLEEGTPDPVIDEAVKEEKLNRLSKSIWSFSRALARHLTPPEEDEEQFQKDVRERLEPAQAEALIAADHRPNRAMYDIGCAINDLPMHFMRRNQMDKDVAHFEDISGGCERIFGTPVPLVYSRHTARYLTAYLLTLPLGLYGSFGDSWNHIALIPSVAVISMFLFGIEELATSLEEPFSILPLIGISNKIGANCDELVKFTPSLPSTSMAAGSSVEEGAPTMASSTKAKNYNFVDDKWTKTP